MLISASGILSLAGRQQQATGKLFCTGFINARIVRMNRTGKYLKRTLKAILLVVTGFVLLLLLLILVIRIPAVQNKVAGLATSYVRKKTHSRVELKNIRISFPKSVIVEGLYLEDIQGDTLLYGGKIKIHMAFRNLISKKIAISSFDLEGATIRLSNSLVDPRFNYTSLLMAFADTTNRKITDTRKATKWRFSLDKVFLKNVRFSYHDVHAGIRVFAAVRESNFSMKEFNPGKSVYAFDEMFLDGLTAHVLRSDSLVSQGNPSGNNPPVLSARKVQIINSSLAYVDSVSELSVHTEVDRLLLEDASIDLKPEQLVIHSLYLSKSRVRYANFESAPSKTPEQPSGNNWKVSLKQVDFEDISFLLKNREEPDAMVAFDPDYLKYDHLSVEASDFYFSTDLTKVFLKKFSATDQNNYSISGFDTGLSMDSHAITATNLNVTLPGSSIDADLNLQFPSLESLRDSLQFSLLHAELRNVRIRNSDILYFSPLLLRYPFFKDRMNTTTISGIVDGPVGKLTGNNIVIKTGTNTVLKTGFSITGLPEVKAATYHIPDLVITTGKKDIELMAGPSIPENIELPGKISLQIAFKGQMKAFESSLQMNSSFGNANLSATVSEGENFKATISLSSFDLGSMLRDTLFYGPVSLTAEANGQGLNAQTIRAQVKAEGSEVTLKKYVYHNLSLEGALTGREFSGKLQLNDENAAFDLAGLVNLTPDQEHVKLRLNVQGADLQKLNFTKDDVRIGLVMETDFRGNTAARVNGTAGIYNLVVSSGKDKYYLDSVLVTSVNEPGKNELRFNSAPVDVKYSGTVSPADLPGVLSGFIGNYFPVNDKAAFPAQRVPSAFDVEIQLRNHPILSKLLLPQLKEFESGYVTGSFDSKAGNLILRAELNNVVYGSTEVSGFAAEVNSNPTELNYHISFGNMSNSLVGLDNILLDGKLADQTLTASLSSIGEKEEKKLVVRTRTVKDGDHFRLTLDPEDFYLMNVRWDIAPDNYVEFGKEGFLVHHLFMNNAESQVYITSVNDQFNDDVNITMKNFRLDDFSSILAKDTSLVKGSVDGDILLKRVDNKYGLVADATIKNLVVRETPLGDLTVKAENPTSGKFDLDVDLAGTGNQLTAKGYYLTDGGGNSINMELAIQSLSMKTIEALSMGQITEAEGALEGKLFVEGKVSAPEITGELVFNNAFFKPALLNNRLELSHETVQFTKEGIVFKEFTLSDAGGHKAVVDGSVFMKQFRDFIFALQVNTQDFLLMNTTARDNKNFYGRMIIDSRIDVSGPMALPVVNAKIKMKKGSNFTFAVPEEKYTTDKGEDVVEFEDSLTMNSILNRDPELVTEKYGFSGFDLSSIIEIDKQATLRLLIDPASTDSLVVRGEAALSFTMDPSGKMSLTGAYNLDEGSYLVSLESIVKKRFDINPGSTIIWNGDPFDAEISIDASYSVRAAPYDLVAAQMTVLSASESGSYKQRYPFLVLLKLRGKLMHPVISFEIQLPPEEKGILGGAVDQKLTMLNDVKGTKLIVH